MQKRFFCLFLVLFMIVGYRKIIPIFFQVVGGIIRGSNVLWREGLKEAGRLAYTSNFLAAS